MARSVEPFGFGVIALEAGSFAISYASKNAREWLTLADGASPPFLSLVSPSSREAAVRALNAADGQRVQLQLGGDPAAPNDAHASGVRRFDHDPTMDPSNRDHQTDHPPAGARVEITASAVDAVRPPGGVVVVLRILSAPMRGMSLVPQAAEGGTLQQSNDDFVAMASHELRTPLTPLLLQAQALLRLSRRANSHLDSSQVVPPLTTIVAHIKRMIALVDALLDFSRLSAGRLMALNPQRCDLVELVREVAARFPSSTLTLSFTEPVIGEWDPTRVDQVITNLVANAIKFGAGNPIIIRVSRDDGKGIVEVQDHGMGIPSSEHARIFNRYERATGDATSGFGIGLWIVKEVLQAHGGNIGISSDVGRGTTMRVELPCENPTCR